MIKFPLFFLVLFLIPLVSAQCPDIILSRSSYLSGETFQAEITGNISKPLTPEDISFSYGTRDYFPAFNLVQASSNKWLVYFNLPKYYGPNTFSVSALCRGQTLTQEKKEVTFSIKKTYDDLYSSVIGQVDGRWNSLNVEENSLALIALAYDPRLSHDGTSSILSKSFQNQCFPSSCNVKDTSLALTALEKMNSSTDLIVNWLYDSENNVKIGLWDLIINSPSNQNCNLLINNQSQSLTLISGTNQISLSLPDSSSVFIALNCSSNSAKISHTYLGNINEFPLSIQDNSITLGNEKCWGVSYRSVCDATSTAHAILALKSAGENPTQEISWLSRNAQTTQERAISYSLGDSSQGDYLMNNQAKEGYWPSSSLSLSTSPSIDATVAALKVSSDASKQAGEEWLFNYLQNSQSLRELLLSLEIFTLNRIEPVLSFSQGFFKVSAESLQKLTLSNNGIFPMNLTLYIDSSPVESSLQPKERKDIILQIPPVSSIEFTSIKIDYSSQKSSIKKEYFIPMIIYPKSYSQQQISALSSTLAQTSFIGVISFFDQSINRTLPISNQVNITLFVINSGSYAQNASMSFSGLYGIMDKVDPSEFSIDPNESKMVSLVFNTQKAFGDYSGLVSLQTPSSSSSIPVYISISSAAGSQTTTTQPVTLTSKGFNMKTLGWMMVTLAVIIAGAFFYLKLRKKKQKPAIIQQLEKFKEQQVA